MSDCSLDKHLQSIDALTFAHRSCAAPICLTLWLVSLSCRLYSSDLLHLLLLLLLFLSCIEIQVMLCKSICATLLCRLVACHQCGVVLTDAWPNPSKQPQIKYFLPFSSTQGGLYSTFQRDKPQRSHPPYLFLSCCRIQSNLFHFPPHPSTKDQGILILHRWIPTLKQDKKLPNRILSARLVPYSSYLWGPITRLDLMAVI